MEARPGYFLGLLKDYVPEQALLGQVESGQAVPDEADIISFGLAWPDDLNQKSCSALSHLHQSKDMAREIVKNGLIVVYQPSAGLIRAYLNRCPHQFTPLEIMPDRFLDREKQHLLCTTHGATFRINDGFCVSGPCAGQALRQVPVLLKDGVLYFRP